MTITVTRTEANPFDVPAAVDVIQGQRLRDAARAEVQLSESLALVPGVTARDRQNFAQDLQLSVRGFGARSTFGVRGVRLYVDGIPATMPDGQGQLSHFDLSSAQRVEILRGPFSALYGNSSGGVLQLFTEKGEGAPVLTASMASGSDGLMRPGLRAAGASGGLGWHLSANHFRTDGWRDHSAARRDVGNVRLDWGDWMLVANTVDVKADDPLGLTRTQFDASPRSVDPVAPAFNTRKTVQQSQLGLVHERALGGGHKLRVMAYGGERTTVQFQSIPPGPQANPLHPGGVIDLERSYAGTDWRWSWKRERLELVAGLSYDHLQEARRGWQNFIGPTLGVQGALRRDERNEVSNLDPYLQAQWKPAPAWTLAAGVRRNSVRFSSDDRYIAGANGNDSGSVRYAATLPVASAMYAVSPQIHLYGAAGRGFETPTFNELAYRPDGVPGLNFGLRPSRSRNFELGAKARAATGDWRHEGTVAVFSTRTKDEIVTQSNTGGRSTFRNAAATERRGLELAGQLSSMGGWRLAFAHTWLDARYADAIGARIPGIARSFTAAEAGWLPPQGWRGGVEWRRSGRVFVNDTNSDAAAAWWTLALHAGWKQDFGTWAIEASARIDNLLDRRYAGSVIVNEGNSRYFEAAPGRQATIKLVASWRL
ncbi:MAG: TonB-dependent receptor [Burkholderiales bacterium]|nr:TonB-dependent receptor [Burkholderiales bacterium]